MNDPSSEAGGAQTSEVAARKEGYLSWVRSIVSVLGARILASAAAFLGNVLVARQLEPTGFGRFYLLFTIMTLVAGLTGPAIDTSLVRFASKSLDGGRTHFHPYFKAVLFVKCLILLITLGIAFVAAPVLNAAFFENAKAGAVPVYAIVLAFAGGGIVAMWGFAQAYFQTHQMFTHYAGYEFCSSLLRFSMVLALIATGNRNAITYLSAYVAAPLIMAAFSWSQLPGAIFSTPFEKAILPELYHFAKWVLLASLFTTITQRMDLLLLGYFAIPEVVVGHYSAGLALALAGELFLLTFYTVLLPKASRIKDPGELRRFIGAFRIPSLLFCLGLSLSIPFSGVFVGLLLGPEYRGTELYFSILLLGVMAALGAAPPMTALYSLGRSRIIAAFEGSRMVLSLVISLWAIPAYGAFGAACAISLVRAVISGVSYIIAHQQVKRAMIRAYADLDGASCGKRDRL